METENQFNAISPATHQSLQLIRMSKQGLKFLKTGYLTFWAMVLRFLAVQFKSERLVWSLLRYIIPISLVTENNHGIVSFRSHSVMEGFLPQEKNGITKPVPCNKTLWTLKKKCKNLSSNSDHKSLHTICSQIWLLNRNYGREPNSGNSQFSVLCVKKSLQSTLLTKKAMLD